MLISDKLKPYINLIIINKKISVLMIFNLIVLICSVGEKSVNRERKRERERKRGTQGILFCLHRYKNKSINITKKGRSNLKINILIK